MWRQEKSSRHKLESTPSRPPIGTAEADSPISAGTTALCASTGACSLWQLGSTRSPAPDIAVHCLEVGMQVVQRLSHIQRHLAPSASEANRFGSMRVEGIKH